jgi:hypothetical protein
MGHYIEETVGSRNGYAVRYWRIDNSMVRLDLMTGVFSIARLAPSGPVPAWAETGKFVSLTRTGEELSIVCDSSCIPPDVRTHGGWRCLRVAGPLDFSLVGVLASLMEPLARAGIPVFVISTFDTDYILIGESHLPAATAVLEQSGHSVEAAVGG